MQTRRSSGSLTKRKKTNKNIASQALELYITVQCSWLQPERAALSVQLCQSPASLPWVSLGCSSIGGRLSFCFMSVSDVLMERALWSPQGKPWPTAGRWELFAQPKLAVQQPLLMFPSQQLLSSCLVQCCSYSAPVCLRVSTTVSCLAGKVLANPPCLGPESSECCLCLAQCYEHTAACKQPHTSLSKLFTEKVVKHGNRPPRKGVKSPCLEGFQRHVDVAL